MSSVPDKKRVGRGFKGLRERYVRRAEFLLKGPEYWERVQEIRTVWNHKYPEWPITIEENIHPQSPSSMFKQLMRDVETDFAYRDEHGFSNVDRDRRAEEANSEWLELVARLATDFWPPEDFPNPYTDTSHPATHFVEATLYAEQWSLLKWLRLSEQIQEMVQEFPELLSIYEPEKFNVFFRDFRLSPEPLRRLESTPINAYGLPKNQNYYLPIFPGMTANDIRQAAPAIAEWVESHFAGRMPEDRMVALADDGLTHQAIADRLGVDRKTVGDVLRSASHVTSLPNLNIT